MKDTANTPKCCYLGCELKADLEAKWGDSSDDYTHGCEHHIGYLLPEQQSTVYRIA